MKNIVMNRLTMMPGLVSFALITAASAWAADPPAEFRIELKVKDPMGNEIKIPVVFRENPAEKKDPRPWLETLPTLNLATTPNTRTLAPGYYRILPALGCLLKTTRNETRPASRVRYGEYDDEPYRFNLALIEKGGAARVCATRDDSDEYRVTAPYSPVIWFHLEEDAEATPDLNFNSPLPAQFLAGFTDQHGGPITPTTTSASRHRISRSPSGLMRAKVMHLSFEIQGAAKPSRLANIQVKESDIVIPAAKDDDLYPSEIAKEGWADGRLAAYLDKLDEPLKSFAKALNARGKESEAAIGKLMAGPDTVLLKQLMSGYGGKFVIRLENLGVDFESERLAYRKIRREWCRFEVAPYCPAGRKDWPPLSESDARYFGALVDLLPELKPGTDPAFIVNAVMYRHGIPFFELNRNGVRLRIEHSPEGWDSISEFSFPKGTERKSLELLRSELRTAMARSKANRRNAARPIDISRAATGMTAP